MKINSSLRILWSKAFFLGSKYSKGAFESHFLKVINNIGTFLIEGGSNLWWLAIDIAVWLKVFISINI